MSTRKQLSDVWNNIQEFDLRPIRDAALQSVGIAVIGPPGSGRHALADAMRCDPASLTEVTQTPVVILSLAECVTLPDVDLIIIITLSNDEDYANSLALAHRCADSGKLTVFLCNSSNVEDAEKVLLSVHFQKAFPMMVGSVQDQDFLLKQFVPRVLSLIHQDRQLSFGRHFPLFRMVIARSLIDDTCLANATYSFSTGLAEVIPAFTLPLSLTDLIVLTKSQAFLVYKLGLLLGFSTRWQDYKTEFGSVIGSGFMLRQLARLLVGFVPGWGIISKVIVAYSGTYVVGYTVLQWYLAGRKIHKQQMKDIYQRAVIKGKIMAYRLVEKTPQIKFKHHKQPVFPTEMDVVEPKSEAKASRFKFGLRRKKTASLTKLCANCSKLNAEDAVYCQYCGQAF